MRRCRPVTVLCVVLAAWGFGHRAVAQEAAVGARPEQPASTSGSFQRGGPSWIGAGLALGALNLPKVGVGAELLGQLRTQVLWPIDLALIYWFENDAELSLADSDLMVHPFLLVPFPAGGSRLHVTAAQLSVASCPFERNMGSDSLLLCAGVQGGWLRAAGEGLLAERSKLRPTFGLQAYARYHFRLGARVGVSYSAGLFLALVRERFGYLDRDNEFREAFRSSLVGARLDLALTYGL